MFCFVWKCSRRRFKQVVIAKSKDKTKRNTYYLSELLHGRNYIYNKVKHQQMKEGINTCGDHVCHRCYKFKNEGFNLKDYQDYMKTTLDCMV